MCTVGHPADTWDTKPRVFEAKLLGPHLIVVDDPLNTAHAMSRPRREVRRRCVAAGEEFSNQPRQWWSSACVSEERSGRGPFRSPACFHPKLYLSLGEKRAATAPGFEADDFLAAAAAKEEKRGGTVFIASGDRDTFQRDREDAEAEWCCEPWLPIL